MSVFAENIIEQKLKIEIVLLYEMNFLDGKLN